MSDVAEILFTSDALTEIKAVPAAQRALVLAKIAQVQKVGWQQSLENRAVKKLKDEIFEIIQKGKGAAYRVLCFTAKGEDGRIVVTTSCVAKSTLLKQLRFKQEVKRAETRRQQWLSHQGGKK